MISSNHPFIYVISDGSINSDNFKSASDNLLRLIEVVVRSNIPLFQIREKQLSARLLFELTERVTALTRGTKTRVLVNDRLDVALTAPADGVHLTSSSLDARAVRSATPDGFLIGASIHSVDELIRARSAGADFAVYGPVFETPRKDRVIGLDSLKEAVKAVAPFPVIALGGIDETNYRSVLNVGTAGFAAIRFLNKVENLEKLSLEFGL